MADNVIYEFKTPEGDVLEWEGPEGMDPKAVKAKFYQTILKQPELSLTIAKQQGYKPVEDDQRTGWQVAGDQAVNVGKGALGLIPGMFNTAKNVVVGSAKMLRGDTRAEGANQVSDAAAGLVTGAVAPLKGLATSARGVGALVAPESVNAPSRQDWEEGAQTGGAMAAGVGLEAGYGKLKSATGGFSADGLQQLANKAREYRTANPVLDSLERVDLTKPLGVLKHGPEAVKSAGAAVAAPVLEKLARIRNAMDSAPAGEGFTGALPEHTGSFPLEDNTIQPTTLPRSEATLRDVIQAQPPHEAAPIWASEAGPRQTGYQASDTPIGAERPGVNPLVEAELQRMRAAETPEQLYARQQQVQNQEFQPDPTAAQSQIGIQRPPAGQLPTTEAMQFEHPIQQLTPEEQGVLGGIFREGKGAAASAKNINIAIQNAPYLLEALPELKNTPPGQMFDAKLFNGYQRVGHELKAVEASIPDATPVPTADMTAALDKMAQNAAASLQNSDVRVIVKMKAILGEKPVLEWKDFIEAKRAFDKEVGVDPGVGRQIYQLFKDASNQVSPKLGELNRKFYTVRLAMDLAKMNLYKGLRLAEVAAKAKGLRK